MNETKEKQGEYVAHRRCPLCQSAMWKSYGTQVFPNNPDHGVSLSCRNWNCPAQEVAGHGKNEERAYEIVLAKFTGSRINLNEASDDLVETPEPKAVIEVATPVKHGRRGRPPKALKSLPVVEAEEEVLPL